MPTPPLTREQCLEAVDLKAKHGTAKGAEALGISQGAFQNRIRRATQLGYAPDHDMTHTVPDGFKVKGVSTLYNADGQPTAQWVKSQADAERQEELFREMVAGLTDDLPRRKPTQGPKITEDKLMTCYPVGDHHLGMFSWHEETGADYDLEIGERLLTGAMDHLVRSSPPSREAAIVLLGDFMHYDSFESVTPTSKNSLDADGRFPKMVRAAFRGVRYMIKAALKRHHHVRVIVEIGNHDLASSILLMEALSNIYEKEPRVEVDTSPRHFHYFRFGKCLVGTHHGHGVKPEKLPLIMATDRPEDWGRSEHRYIWTGHVHHYNGRDIEGCWVESFRVLAPPDAWAANKGYRSIRDMKAITLHEEFGETSRQIFNPKMLL